MRLQKKGPTSLSTRKAPKEATRKQNTREYHSADRRAAASARLRKLKPYLRFNRAVRASSGAIEHYILTRDQFGGLLLLAAQGEPTSAMLASAISSWAIMVVQREMTTPSEKTLCLCCDTAFASTAAPPDAFSISVPFADWQRVLIAGVCAACATKGREELEQATVRRMRAIWPSAHLVGRAGRA
jgi:hypothetical protein